MAVYTHDVEPSYRIPNALGQLGVLQQAVRAWRVERTHTHVHAAKGKHPSQSLRPEVLGRSAVDTLERMKCENMLEEAPSQHGEDAREVAQQHIRSTELVMFMSLLEESQVAREAILALPLFDLIFHGSHVGRHPELFSIAEPDVVVGVAFHQMDAFILESSAQVLESLAEEVGEKE